MDALPPLNATAIGHTRSRSRARIMCTRAHERRSRPAPAARHLLLANSPSGDLGRALPSEEQSDHEELASA
jgi:hypothetical protein